ncbi:MAG: hypothetical protein A3B90_01695 [Candidatus Magasanikbacteria bacterium RIFCSPHIGHO2_02_FULL_41_13]|uniref:Uncharacterized protein n=1 Tax=Candidatus Magasanikbacteria bacterium RIFCSPHIGHO2_02_FULL_41_13 TaxID=1798676 RepID=A0A1F6M3X7_9BACT|nr:MAG: hypothetical protein A3B90_01695 [Candidatus Magasanikbacteria bacterium RIFCSPHIGHO2_02_FULL_41_13]
MTFTLTIPLIIYFIFLLIFLIFIGVNLYHLVESASLTTTSFIFTFFIFASSIIVLYFTATLLIGVDWQEVLFSTENSSFQTDPF